MIYLKLILLLLIFLSNTISQLIYGNVLEKSNPNPEDNLPIYS